MPIQPLTGKTFLILGGQPQEVIDGVRYFANHARPELHGWHAAAALKKAGAKVLLLSTEFHKMPNTEYLPLPVPASATDLLEAAQAFLRQEKVDAVLQLACISSIRAAHISTTKLKVKKEAGSTIAMEVMGNIDLAAHLRAAWPELTLLGYDNYQQFFERGNPEMVSILRPVILQAQQDSHTRHPADISGPVIDRGKLHGKKIIVTGGPTAEQLTQSGDIITNFSSGAQGLAIAEALAAMEAHVVFITSISPPHQMFANITILEAQSAHSMHDAVMHQLPADAYIGVAAVADFGLPAPLAQRLQENEPYTLQLKQNPDILQAVSHHARRPAMVIGFAAETHDLIAYASAKLRAKGADAVCANPVDEASRKRIGSGNNQVTWLAKTGDAESWPIMTKYEIGQRIGEKIAQRLDQ